MTEFDLCGYRKLMEVDLEIDQDSKRTNRVHNRRFASIVTWSEKWPSNHSDFFMEADQIRCQQHG